MKNGHKSSDLDIQEEIDNTNLNPFNSIIEKVRNESETINKINGVVIGRINSLDENGGAFVDFNLDSEKVVINASSIVILNKSDVGKQAAVAFQNGNLYRPIILGLIISYQSYTDEYNKKESMDITVDKKRVTINAEKEIVLKCGKASITLTSAGKILIRGKYLLSRSSGVNKIKGGSVQIN